MNYFVTGIDTDVGKTVASAILVEALGADYWKPVQCGEPRDTTTVRSLVNNPSSQFHNEGIFLKESASPHQAAHNEGKTLTLNEVLLPITKNQLIIEGAGGLMVPLNRDEWVIDMAKKFCQEVVLVVRMYLGCINHSILTIDALNHYQLPIRGIIFNGDINKHSESVILDRCASRKLLHIAANSSIDKENIKKWALELRKNWD